MKNFASLLKVVLELSAFFFTKDRTLAFSSAVILSKNWLKDLIVCSAMTLLHSSVKCAEVEILSTRKSSTVILGTRYGCAWAILAELPTTLATVTMYSSFKKP